MKLPLCFVLLAVFASVTAHADDAAGEAEIVFFPLADMESEINTSLKTVVEAGDSRPKLLISGDSVLPASESPRSAGTEIAGSL
ncbi:MAG: hypothetical protein EBR09_09590 [Proteobacteria bacterium]|nr:hypothetical protein [Pseudomonadota bacterium]